MKKFLRDKPFKPRNYLLENHFSKQNNLKTKFKIERSFERHYDYKKFKYNAKRSILSDKIKKENNSKRSKYLFNKNEYQQAKAEYLKERIEPIKQGLSKSMIIVFALVFFMISSSLLNARIEVKTTSIPNVNEKYQYTYKYVNLDDIDNIGKLMIETPTKLFNTISTFVSSLTGLFAMENGSIVLLDSASVFINGISKGIGNVVDFLTGGIKSIIQAIKDRLINIDDAIDGAISGAVG